MAEGKAQSELKHLVVTLSDTVPAGEKTAPGVNISTLTGGVLTNESRIKGISFFNNAPAFFQLLWYRDKLIIGCPDTVSASRSVAFPVIIYYQ